MDKRAIEEAGFSYDDWLNRVRAVFAKEFGDAFWVRDVFEDYVVAQDNDGVSYRVPMSAPDWDNISFSPREKWVKVLLQYADISESHTDRRPLTLRFPLQEARDDKQEGLFDGVIVVEGRSANGHVYTAEALKTGVAAFEGALMFADHPTELEERTRPERSVRDVVGRVREVYLAEEDGKTVLRAKFQISEAEEALRKKIAEGILGDVSLRAYGSGHQDNQGNFIVDAFEPAPFTSVDVVTVGAAGGRIVGMLSESQRAGILRELLEDADAEKVKEARPDLFEREVRKLEESENMEEVQKQLQEALAEKERLLEENTRLFRELRTEQAGRVLASVLAEAEGLPEAARKRVEVQAEALVEAFATHGSEQTEDEFKAEVGKLIEAEREYVAQLLPGGVIANAPTGAKMQEANPEDAERKLVEAFRALGLNDQQAQMAAQGR